MRTDQWDLLQEVVRVLEPLEIATVFLNYECNTSVSCLYLILFGIIENLQVSTDDSPACNHLKNEIVSAIKTGWSLNAIDPHGVYILSATLDPRFKNLKFLINGDKKSVRDYLKQRIEDLQNDEVVSIEPIPAAAPSPTKKTELDKLFGDEELESSAYEVDAHFSEKLVARNTNLLSWCRDNTSNFPHIAQIAKKYLSIP